MRAPNALMAPFMPEQPQVQLVRMEDGSVVPVQITGATQGVDPRLLSLAEQAWSEYLPGGQLVVTTGVSNHSPTNHAPGHAIDFYAQTADGQRLPWNDPRVRQASESFWSLGGHGVGAGPTYMGGQHYHWDISRNGVRSWSDDDGGAADRGPGAAQWLNGVSAPGGDYGSGSSSTYDPSRPPSVFNPPPGYTPPENSPAPDNSLLALAMEMERRQEAEREEKERRQLDPRDFMSRRAFQITPYGVG